MKILHASTFDIDGGASRAAYRLHDGLRKAGVASSMLSRVKTSNDEYVHVENTLLSRLAAAYSSLPLRFYPKHQQTSFSSQWFPDRISRKIAALEPDIVNLHWICHGFLQIETLAKIDKPLVWTLHDMWAFTGGCHYTKECNRYTSSCGSCPELGSNKRTDLSNWTLRRKEKAWKNVNLTIVSPSNWLAECARSSFLFKDQRVEVIPYGLDTNIYRPIDRQTACELLHLAPDKQYILFGSMAPGDPRKGFHLLQSALKAIAEPGYQENVELLVLGATKQSQQNDFGLKVHYLGRFSDDLSLSIAYSAADVFVAPSTQDNLPNTIMEAISCGVPCVSFNIGGIPDMITHQHNGYLAKPFDVQDLAQGITWILEEEHRHQILCKNARKKAEQEYALEVQASRYLRLYEEIQARQKH